MVHFVPALDHMSLLRMVLATLQRYLIVINSNANLKKRLLERTSLLGTLQSDKCLLNVSHVIYDVVNRTECWVTLLIYVGTRTTLRVKSAMQFIAEFENVLQAIWAEWLRMKQKKSCLFLKCIKHTHIISLQLQGGNLEHLL